MNMPKRSGPRAFGIIGENLSHTLSPRIHNYLFKEANLDCSYDSFEVGRGSMKKALEGIRTLGIGGVNVTFPHKETVAEYLDDLDMTALETGAVNTIDNTGGRMVGHNTDIAGLLSTLDGRMKVRLEGKVVMILGAGGAARACLWVLLNRNPGKILILNRTARNARTLVAGFDVSQAGTEVTAGSPDDIGKLPSVGNIDLLINATSAEPAFLKRMITVLSERDLLRHGTILDLNYGGRALSREAVPDDLEYVDGLYMLCAQAVESFRIWTGIAYDPAKVYEYLTQNPGER
jgi:shikimate dehydrogenase